jgi:hypothetical protein
VSLTNEDKEILAGLADRLQSDGHYPEDDIQWFGIKVREIVDRLCADAEPRRFGSRKSDCDELESWRHGS